MATILTEEHQPPHTVPSHMRLRSLLRGAAARLSVTVLVAVAAMLAAGTLASAAGASQLPRIFSTLASHGEEVSNVFSVRPRQITVDSADGGELAIHWTQWTRTAASGYGRAHPDHGSYVISVRAADVIHGVFTRLTVIAIGPGLHHRPDRMMLATLGGTALSWVEVEWVRNPESGFSPWRG